MATDQAKRLFEAARKKVPSERPAYLDEISEFDPDLRNKVESLLAAEDDSFLEKGPPGAVTVDKSTAIKPLTPDTNAPERIGPYRILRTIGEGGMGVVYEAEQEKPVRRKVALKLIKWGMDTKQVIARFESERQALALMNHPSIASVYDAGATNEGRPYFAMEYIKGIPITEYCDKHRLTIKERLELFIQACEGVQHAHQKGIIHRDIKPSNVLVAIQDDKPVPKIIDFGVAKATSQRLTEHTVVTELGQLIGTPEYMSPEQAEMTNLDIDTRTDVYSLGVLLYELLVGAQPFDSKELRQAGLAEIQRKLREDAPQRPSTRVRGLGEASTTSASNRRIDVRTLEKQLNGDLDWITMKAMEKDRTRRYETANALTMECRRFLMHEPVLARPPSPGYLLRRFIRRNRPTVIAGSVALLAVLAGAAAATVGFVRATNAERAAIREAEKARQTSDFLIELFRVSDPSEARGNSISAREILDRGADRLQTELSSEPLVRAAMMNTIGNVYASLGLYESAQTLLDDALITSEAIHGKRSTEVAEILFGRGELARYRGEYGRSESLHREALSIRQELLSKNDLTIGESLHGLGLALYFGSKYEEAETTYREALVLYVQARAVTDARVAKLKSSLASLLSSTDRFDESEEIFQESLRIFRQLYGDIHPEVASDLNDLALLYREVGRLDDAQAAFAESLEIFRKLYPGDHPFTAETQAHFAGVVAATGDYERAEALYRGSIAMLERTVGREHMLTARANDSLGVFLLSQRRYEDAEPVIAESVDLHKTLLGERHISTGRAINNMAALLFLKGNYARAEPYFRESLSIRIQHLGDQHADVANSKNNLADLLNRLGNYVEAEPLAADAAEIYGSVFSQSHWRAAVARNVHGRSLGGLGQYGQAEALILESNDIIEKTRAGSVYHRMALQRTIELYAAWEKPDQATQYEKKLVCIEGKSEC